MARNKFQKGNKFGTGGAKPGAGRPPSEIRKAAKELMSARIDHAVKVVDDLLSPQSDADHKTKLQAAELVLAYAWGKPSQSVDLKTSTAYVKTLHPDTPIEEL